VSPHRLPSCARIEKYGRIAVDAGFQTTVPHVYAIGDVVGGGLPGPPSVVGPRNDILRAAITRSASANQCTSHIFFPRG